MNHEVVKKKSVLSLIIVSLSLLLIIVITSASLYYYLAIYRNRNLFDNPNSSLDTSFYEKNNFKKITMNNSASSGLYSYYVPSEWVVIDNDLQVYGDVLTGSNAYMNSYPNSLGVLNSDLCTNFASELDVKFKKNSLYSKSEMTEKGIRKLGNYEVCALDYTVQFNSKPFNIKQVYLFQKNRIYQLFIQISDELSSNKDIMKLISESVEIKD